MKLTAFLMGEESLGLVSFQKKNVFLFNDNLKLIVPVLLQITNPGYLNCRRMSLTKDALFEMDCNLKTLGYFSFFFFFFLSSRKFRFQNVLEQIMICSIQEFSEFLSVSVLELFCNYVSTIITKKVTSQ